MQDFVRPVLVVFLEVLVFPRILFALRPDSPFAHLSSQLDPGVYR